MAPRGFEGAYLHSELGEQICLTVAETQPISWKCQRGWRLLFALSLPHGLSGEGGITAQDLVPLPGTLQPRAVLKLQLCSFQTLREDCVRWVWGRRSGDQTGAESFPSAK